MKAMSLNSEAIYLMDLLIFELFKKDAIINNYGAVKHYLDYRS